jgi:hypothetical protein
MQRLPAPSRMRNLPAGRKILEKIWKRPSRDNRQDTSISSGQFNRSQTIGSNQESN